MITIGLVLTAVAVADLPVRDTARYEQEVIELARGGAEVLTLRSDLVRVAVADPSVVSVVVVSPREIMINALALGTTTLLVWETDKAPRSYTIDVSLDAGALQRQISAVFPGEAIEVTAHGNVVVLSGAASGGEVARRIVEMVSASGATVIRNFYCIRPHINC